MEKYKFLLSFFSYRFALCALLYARFAPFNVETGKIKSQYRFRFDGHQPTNVDFTSFSKYKIQDLTPSRRWNRYVAIVPISIPDFLVHKIKIHHPGYFA